MIEDGYNEIMNVDVSQTVIDQMTEAYKEKCPQLKF